MNRKEFLNIIKRYRDHSATEDERELIETYYELLGVQEGPGDKLADERLEGELLRTLWEKIYEQEQESARKKRTFLRYRNIAAVLMVLIGSSAIFFWLRKTPEVSNPGAPKEQAIYQPPVILPAGQKAVLTLGDGTKVPLEAHAEKTFPGLARQQNGNLVYQRLPQSEEPVRQYNTLSTPNGAKFKLVLSDGTRVWLNAGSALRYPVRFAETDRSVTLTGEAYFEVAEEAGRPFRVHVQDVDVLVLGTRFNIKAYGTMDDMKTTLAAGKVKVIKGAQNRLLGPGEQAVVEKGTHAIVVKDVDLRETLAWKKGLFYFDKTNIQDIMDELSRWYNVDVVYDRKALKTLNFSGVMSRYKKIEEVLKRISLTGTVHFSLEGRTVVVRD